MRLIASTSEFVMGGHPYPDFPILLWDTMESCAPANQFFRYYLLRGAIGSKKSWASTGQALYDYFSFLQAHELSWDDVDRGEEKTLLAAYRDYSFEVAKLARSTVRNRLLYVCEFYSFAQRQEWIEKLPFGYETRRVIKSAGGLRLAMLRIQRGRSHRGATRITVASVAREVGVSAALIHNHYPTIADAIRQYQGRGSRAQRDAKHQALKQERERARELRREIASLRADVRKLSTINEVLQAEKRASREKIGEVTVVPLTRRRVASSSGR